MSETMTTSAVSLSNYADPTRPTWCPGCGDYGIFKSVKDAFVGLGLEPHKVVVVSGIGCGSKLPDYLRVNAFLGIHGRTLPLATGIHLANHNLKVVVVTGDGDGYGIGGNHFLHTMRRNPDITMIVQNNMVYALTKGQYSPTSAKGVITSTSPEGSIETAINPIALGIVGGATFVARSFSGDAVHLAQVIMAAVRHKGFSLVDVLQPCVIYNRANTYEWYRERVYKLEEAKHDSSSAAAALEKAGEWGQRIPIGVFYETKDIPTYGEQVSELAAGPLVKHSLNDNRQQLEALKEEFI